MGIIHVPGKRQRTVDNVFLNVIDEVLLKKEDKETGGEVDLKYKKSRRIKLSR